jgi:hypothetical protein
MVVGRRPVAKWTEPPQKLTAASISMLTPSAESEAID